MSRVLVTRASGGLGGGVLAAFAAAGWQIAPESGPLTGAAIPVG